MKIILFSFIIYQLRCTPFNFSFAATSGVTNIPTPPPVPDTTVVGHTSPPQPSPALTLPSPDTFSTTTDPSLTIFYDAMEECSQQFFNTTYINHCSCLCARINITLIPCQKAMDSKGQFTCLTPGDPTCRMNKIHSCAIAQIPDQTQLMNYLACISTGTNAFPDFATCASLHRVNDALLQQCANSDTGKNLCKAYSDKIMPDMNTIPGFIFKKPEEIKTTDLFQHLDYYRNHICYNDVQLAVCSQLKAAKIAAPPTECNQKLAFGIFYKTMDEKTQKWFHELGSVFDKFSTNIAFKYQPCMFAELSADGKLDCQDANDKDCIVGKTHACAIWLISEPKTLYQFLNCTMQDPKTLPDFEKCATSFKVPYEPIKACATSDRGKGLCYDSSKTRPNSDEVPMFSFELTFDEVISKKTPEATNLQTIFCDELKKYGIAYPIECQPTCYGG